VDLSHKQPKVTHNDTRALVSYGHFVGAGDFPHWTPMYVLAYSHDTYRQSFDSSYFSRERPASPQAE